MEVRLVREDEGRRVRDFRLRALSIDPDAFASRYAEEASRPEAHWDERARLVAKAEHAVTFVAEAEGVWVGMVFGFLEGADPDTVDLAGLWVEPNARHQGIGHELLEAVIAWARKLGSRQVRLWVTANQADAHSLYKDEGFEETGRRQPLRSNPELETSEMILPLPPAAVGAD